MLFTETPQERSEWKQKLEESLGLRKVVQESNKVFEIESLSVDTFLLPSSTLGPTSSVWHDGTLFTGKVTCSVPFSKHPLSIAADCLLANVAKDTPDGRGLVAIGCAEGVWIGYRHDSRCKNFHIFTLAICCLTRLLALRRVLHLKMVTQCAILDEFGLFLVLADKVGLIFALEQL